MEQCSNLRTKRGAERMKEYRKRTLEEEEQVDFDEFSMNTPFLFWTTDEKS